MSWTGSYDLGGNRDVEELDNRLSNDDRFAELLGQITRAWNISETLFYRGIAGTLSCSTYRQSVPGARRERGDRANRRGLPTDRPKRAATDARETSCSPTRHADGVGLDHMGHPNRKPGKEGNRGEQAVPDPRRNVPASGQITIVGVSPA